MPSNGVHRPIGSRRVVTTRSSWAEVLGALDIFIGVNAVDYSGYPDCRPEYIASFEAMANLATKAGVEGTLRFEIHAPLMELSKAEIVLRAEALGVDLGQFFLQGVLVKGTPAGAGCAPSPPRRFVSVLPA